MVKKNNSFWEKYTRRFKYHRIKLIRIQDTPHSVAIGASIGVFLGVFPTFMLAIPVAIGIAALIKANKTSAVIGSLIMNPLTTPFFWIMSAYTGGLVTNTDWRIILKLAKNFDFSNLMKSAMWIYLLGNTIVALFFSYITYLLIYFIVKNYQIKKMNKIKENLVKN